MTSKAIKNGYVFVVDRNGHPLMPCLSSRARLLCKKNAAKIFCLSPFTIQLKERVAEKSNFQDIELKIDPGSKTTGFSLNVLGVARGWVAKYAIHLEHRSEQIRNSLLARHQIRKGRRHRKSRYRAPRFSNRSILPRVQQGYNVWHPPSVISRIEQISSMVVRLKKHIPILKIIGEMNKFDMQKMVSQEISGVEYSQGTLQGFELREYLLDKFRYTCVYCNKRSFEDKVRLEVDHLVSRSKGGSNKVSNLVISCQKCNLEKSNISLDDFLKDKPDLLIKIKKQLDEDVSLSYASHVNVMRKELYSILSIRTNLPIETVSSFQTKFNRMRQRYSKNHWVDAACLGNSGIQVDIENIHFLSLWKSIGRGNRQMCLMNKFGFPRSGAKTKKRFISSNGKHFQSGDKVKMVQKSGKYKGIYVGYLSIRSSGKFDIVLEGKKRISSSWKNFVKIQSFCGYKVSPIAVI